MSQQTGYYLIATDCRIASGKDGKMLLSMEAIPY